MLYINKISTLYYYIRIQYSTYKITNILYIYNLKLMYFSFKSPLASEFPGDGIKVPLTTYVHKKCIQVDVILSKNNNINFVFR